MYFKQGNLPQFDVSSPRRTVKKFPPTFPNGCVAVGADGEARSGHDDDTHASTSHDRVLTRISDRQGPCIVALKPSLLYPSEEENSFAERPLAQDAQGFCCTQNRNRKTLGNYKNTGFCQYHVLGSEGGSVEFWEASGFRSVRGFNLQRCAGESKLRHMLCLETGGGKVFLKWCTQCHLWKNFDEFCSRVNDPAVASPGIDTFCGNCYRRQVQSRSKQLQKRRIERSNKLLGKGVGQALDGSVEDQAREVVTGATGQPLLVPASAAGVGAIPSSAQLAVDAPKTPEISEQQKVSAGGQEAANVVVSAAQVVSTGYLVPNSAALVPVAAPGSAVKRPRKRKSELSPEEAKRLREMQLQILNSIPVTDYPFWHPNESLFFEALDTVTIDKMTLRQYYASPDRVGDILYFPLGRHPAFIEENNPIPKRGNLPELIEKERSMGKVYYPNMRVSDGQRLCVNSLEPMLMFPVQDPQTKQNAFVLRKPTTSPCANVRNTSEAKKKLENYKFTGFCLDCVKGEGQASYQTWLDTGMQSIRGFNLNRKKVDHRLRHLVCLQSEEGNVFLKWCTQCHTWKNLATYFQRAGEQGGKNKLTTFCAICHRRQIASRKMQSQARKPGKVQAANGVQHP